MDAVQFGPRDDLGYRRPPVTASFEDLRRQGLPEVLFVHSFLPGNNHSFQATLGHSQLASVRLDGSVTDTRRRAATVRRCPLSSGSRVRILPGALKSETI
jgi:hypothetical protein